MGGMISNGRAQYEAGGASVQGLKEFILRVDMMTYSEQDNFMLDTLRILVAFQNNMQIQPRLLPGDNDLYLDVPALDAGDTCSVRWNYATPEGHTETSLTTDSAGRVEETVAVAVDNPEDIVMNGVTIQVM